MLNKIDGLQCTTDNFWECRERVGRLGITNVVRTYDYIYMLSELIDPNNEALDDFHDIIGPLAEVIKECETNKTCPFCEDKLYLSDLPQYDYVCANCDENFYECEVK